MSIPILLNFKQLITIFPEASYTDAVKYMGLVSTSHMRGVGMNREQISNVYRKFEHEKEKMKKEIAADKARTKMLEKLGDTTKLRGAIAEKEIKENNKIRDWYNKMKANDKLEDKAKDDANLEFLSEYENEVGFNEIDKNPRLASGFDEMDENANREFLLQYEDEFAKMGGGKRRKKSCRRKKFSKRKKSFRRKKSRT